MRQQLDKQSTFYICLNCDRAQWIRDAERSVGECRHCGGPLERRWPLTLALREEDRQLLKFISHYSKTKIESAAQRAIEREFRRVATEHSARGGNLPHWAAEWLQNHPA